MGGERHFLATDFTDEKGLGAHGCELTRIHRSRADQQDHWRVLRDLRQAGLEVCFKGKCVGIFRADFLVEGKVIVEIKAVEHLLPIHDAQLLNYLKATSIPLGLLLNFGPKAQVRRRIY